MRSNRNIILNTVYIILGAVLLIISSLGKIDDIYVGFGAGLAAVGKTERRGGRKGIKGYQ